MEKLNCKNCKKEFFVHRYRKDCAKFCSSSCYGLAMKNGIIPAMQYWLGKEGKTKYWLGKNRDTKLIEKMRLTRIGHTPWNKGKKFQEVTNEKNSNWRGDSVGYNALHTWIARKLGKPMICSFCNIEKESTRKIHWANKSGEYKRDFDDWLRLCVSCHFQYDSNR